MNPYVDRLLLPVFPPYQSGENKDHCGGEEPRIHFRAAVSKCEKVEFLQLCTHEQIHYQIRY